MKEAKSTSKLDIPVHATLLTPFLSFAAGVVTVKFHQEKNIISKNAMQIKHVSICKPNKINIILNLHLTGRLIQNEEEMDAYDLETFPFSIWLILTSSSVTRSA